MIYKNYNLVPKLCKIIIWPLNVFWDSGEYYYEVILAFYMIINRIRNKLEEIKNQDYGSNDEIEKKLKFDKRNKNQTWKSKHWGPNIKFYKIREIDFLMANTEFIGEEREKRKGKRKRRGGQSQTVF